MRILIGIDDTDNKVSRGTGYNSRQLALSIEKQGLGQVHGITRHQLLVHPDIPYTSQNSSACLDVETSSYDKLHGYCRRFMMDIGAIGSDVGLCMHDFDKIDPEIVSWGMQAKSMVLVMDDAYKLSKKHQIYLEGLTGTNVGIIGALAAIGLRASGQDGRFIWLNSRKNLRDIEDGIHSVAYLHKHAGIDDVRDIEGKSISQSDKVYLNEWARPVLQHNKSVLLLERILNNNDYEWRCASKEYVKSVSN